MRISDWSSDVCSSYLSDAQSLCDVDDHRSVSARAPDDGAGGLCNGFDGGLRLRLSVWRLDRHAGVAFDHFRVAADWRGAAVAGDVLHRRCAGRLVLVADFRGTRTGAPRHGDGATDQRPLLADRKGPRLNSS